MMETIRSHEHARKNTQFGVYPALILAPVENGENKNAFPFNKVFDSSIETNYIQTLKRRQDMKPYR
jgi:hypothetical protein